jgi:hypothetical protein
LDSVKETRVAVQLRARQGVLDRFKAYVKIVQGYGKVRRFWLSKFRPGYVERMRRQRRGECLRCGSCCALMIRCPYLEKGNHCLIYGRHYRQCSNFPIDQRDLRYLEGVCGFYFVREESA